jgi:hypothetical protein
MLDVIAAQEDALAGPMTAALHGNRKSGIRA